MLKYVNKILIYDLRLGIYLFNAYNKQKVKQFMLMRNSN